MWSARLQEKHIAMIAKSNLCFGLAILYYPFHEQIDAMIHPSTSSVLMMILLVLAFFWTFMSSRSKATDGSIAPQYTDEYVKGIFLRSYHWTLNALIPYLALLWFSEGWTYTLGTPDLSTAGQFGFGLVLFVQGSTASWWLLRDHLSSDKE